MFKMKSIVSCGVDSKINMKIYNWNGINTYSDIKFICAWTLCKELFSSKRGVRNLRTSDNWCNLLEWPLLSCELQKQRDRISGLEITSAMSRGTRTLPHVDTVPYSHPPIGTILL